MTSDDAKVLRRAAWPTVAASAVVWVVAWFVAGGPGLLGAVLGTVVVLAFCGIGIAVLMRVRGRDGYALLNTALLVYLVKILALAGLLVAFRDTTAFNTKAFGWSILVGVLVWTAAEVRAFGQLQILYVDPEAGAPREATDASPSERP